MIRLLIVDDDESTLKSLRRNLLSDARFDVEICPDPQRASRSIQSNPIDVALVDYMMPGRTGIDVLSELRQHQPEAARILMSGGADREALVQALKQAQIHAFVEKPFAFSELIRVLLDAARETEERRKRQVLAGRYG